MVAFLVTVGIALVVLGAWGGPKHRTRPDKAERIPREATVQEAWDILTTPVEYEEEQIKIPEHRPWYVPGRDRRFLQGVLVGLGAGLVVTILVAPAILPKQVQKSSPTDLAAESQQHGAGAATPDTGAAGTADQGAAGQGTAAGQGAAGQGAGGQVTPATVNFVVEPGSSTQDIATALKAAKLITDEAAFLQRVGQLGAETQLKAGTFVLPSNASVDTIITELTK